MGREGFAQNGPLTDPRLTTMLNQSGGKMRGLAIAMAIVSVVKCGGGGSTPTAPTAPPASIAGSYGATVTASATCSGNLPSETRALEFLATITQTGASVQVQLIAHVPGVPEV